MEEQIVPSIVLMQGPPACGKSTYARKYNEQHPETSVIVSRDAFRHARGKYWVPSQEKYITALERFAISEGLVHGYTVIVDATNMNPAMIANIVEIAREYEVAVFAIMIHATLEECIKRDLNKDREHTVGETVIRNFYKKYQDYCNQHGLDHDNEFSMDIIYNPECN